MFLQVEDVSELETIKARDREENLVFEGENSDESSAIEPVICSQYASGEDMQSDDAADGTTVSTSEDASSFGPFLKYCYKKNVLTLKTLLVTNSFM